jgi:hypothetical protein
MYGRSMNHKGDCHQKSGLDVVSGESSKGEFGDNKKKEGNLLSQWTF